MESKLDPITDIFRTMHVTTNVVLKATVMPEWRKIFEAEDSDLPDLGAMEVCSSTEMGAPGASHLGTGGHGPKTDRSRPRSVPVNAVAFSDFQLGTFQLTV
jgi:hypothetical protein